MLIDIPGFSKYKIEVETRRVISYHKSEKGRVLIPHKNNNYSVYFNSNQGYTLYNELGRSYYSIEFIDKLIDNHIQITSYSPKTLVKSDEEIMKRDEYIIGTISNVSGMFSASATPVRHLDIAAAKVEAERLAIKDSTKKFIVLKVEGIASTPKVIWQ